MEEAEHYVSNGNIFADLGLPDAEERQLKAYLIMEIEQAVHSERLTGKQAAQKLDLDQHSLAELLEGALSGHSTNQLIQYLNCLGRDVELFATVRERAPEAEAAASEKAREAVAA